MTEDEMVGQHRQFHGHEFEQVPGDSEGQGGPACCSPWGCKESDTTEQRTEPPLPGPFLCMSLIHTALSKGLTHNASTLVMTPLPHHHPKILHRNVEAGITLKFKGEEISNHTN